MSKTTNVIICGTGGQGILLTSEVLCTAAKLSGYDVKKSEVHGMSQRGGSVSSHVRFGEKVYSPLVEKGDCDLILAMEKMEGLRWTPFLAPKGKLIACDLKITPMTVNTGDAVYPDIDAMLAESSISYQLIKAYEKAEEIGNIRVMNVVLIGAIASSLQIKEDVWIKAIAEKVPPKALEVNLKAFEEGKKLTLSGDGVNLVN